ncbi:hypothetical protein BJ912DRAFT_1065390 [Pholiota molesta]|nr:hypothetical protein BJ912DRAFT_1065390 [Pholiota molesta]
MSLERTKCPASQTPSAAKNRAAVERISSKAFSPLDSPASANREARLLTNHLAEQAAAPRERLKFSSQQDRHLLALSIDPDVAHSASTFISEGCVKQLTTELAAATARECALGAQANPPSTTTPLSSSKLSSPPCFSSPAHSSPSTTRNSLFSAKCVWVTDLRDVHPVAAVHSG